LALLTLFEALGPVFVMEAAGGSQLDHLLSHDGPYDLVISQAALSGSRGLEVLAKARERGDNTPFILIQSVHQNFVRITMGGGPQSIVSTRLVNTVALLDLVRQFVIGGGGARPRD
jgi:DNA-binding NarL/FixJ family response regulator